MEHDVVFIFEAVCWLLGCYYIVRMNKANPRAHNHEDSRNWAE